MRRVVAILLVVLLGIHQPLWLSAQEPAGRPSVQAAPQAQAAASAPALPTVEALGVSFERIKRELRTQPATASGDGTGLKLDYYVQVMGIAPEIQLFTAADLAPGVLPLGAPTHREMIRDLWTRPEFAAPSVPIGSLAILGLVKLAKWQAEQMKKRKADAERKRREDELRAKYPDLVVR